MSDDFLTPPCRDCGGHEWIAITPSQTQYEAPIAADGTVGRNLIVDKNFEDPRTFLCDAACGAIVEIGDPLHSALEDLYLRRK